MAYEIITKDFTRLTPDCALNVRASWDAMSRVAKSAGGLLWLTETFKLCEPLSNVEALADWLESVYFNLAMGESNWSKRKCHVHSCHLCCRQMCCVMTLVKLDMVTNTLLLY